MEESFYIMQDADDFVKQIDSLILKLSTGNTMESLESICLIYIKAEMNAATYTQFINILTSILGEDLGTFLMFLQFNQNMQFNPAKGYRAIIARLIKLKTIYGQVFQNAQNAMARPFSFRGAIASGDINAANVYFNFARADGCSFACEFIFNELLQLSIQIIGTLENKIKSNNSIIDNNMCEQFIKDSNELNESLKKILEENKINSKNV
jgi:hypothetical protein